MYFFSLLLWGEKYYPIDSRRVGWLYLPPGSPTISAGFFCSFFNRPASSLSNFRPISLKEDNLSTHNYTANQTRKLLVISLSYDQLGLISPTTTYHLFCPHRIDFNILPPSSSPTLRLHHFHITPHLHVSPSFQP